jgi:hypothetical protein
MTGSEQLCSKLLDTCLNIGKKLMRKQDLIPPPTDLAPTLENFEKTKEGNVAISESTHGNIIKFGPQPRDGIDLAP